MPSARQQSNFSQLKAHDEQLERLGEDPALALEEILPGDEDGAIVATLSRQLSWSHVVALLPLKSAEARQHYSEQAARERRNVRETRSNARLSSAKSSLAPRCRRPTRGQPCAKSKYPMNRLPMQDRTSP